MTKRKARGDGEGSIYERADGRWAATISLGYIDNKRKRKTFYGETRSEVAEQLKRALHTQQQGLPVAPKRQTVEHFLNNWLETAAKPALRGSTYATYESHIRVHIIRGLGRKVLSDLNAQDVQAFINRKLASPRLSKRTVADIYAILRRALDLAVRWDLVPRNVATLIDRPRVERKEMGVLTPEYARQLLESIQGDPDEALFTVALSLGLRRGETLGLRWQDVDLAKGILQVRPPSSGWTASSRGWMSRPARAAVV